MTTQLIEKTEKKQSYTDKLKGQIFYLKDRNTRLEFEARTKMFRLPEDLEKKVQCVLAYRLPYPNREVPLYLNKQEMLQKYIEEGLRQDYQLHANLFSKLGEFATDLTPLTEKVA